MHTQKEDLAFGEQKEHDVWPTINNTFRTTFKRHGGFATIDYADPSNTIWLELKSRRVAHNKWRTALIGANKVEFCRDPNRHYYFVFNYLDGLYYIKYDKETFADFFIQEEYRRGEREDCSNAPQRVYHIPVEKLSPLPETITL